MGFCEIKNDKDIFILTIDGSDGWSQNAMDELKQALEDISCTAKRRTKGLITTFSSDPFPIASSYLDEELTQRMAEVVRQLFGMRFPTVAAVTGDIKTSLAMALFLAHDDASLLKTSKYEVADLRDGRNSLPSYLAALLRDKAPFPLMRSKLVLQSEAIVGSQLAGDWDLFETTAGEKDDVMKNALSIVNRSVISTARGDGFSTTRKSLFPESWKSVSV